MSASERKADIERPVPRFSVSKVCLRAESGPNGVSRPMSANSQQRKSGCAKVKARLEYRSVRPNEFLYLFELRFERCRRQ